MDFTPPRITAKVPVFGTDKWVERQNQHIAKQFTEIVRKIESLYRNDAARQIESAQRNVLADYGELFQLRRDVKMLAENYDNLKSIFETMLDQMANHSIRSKIFAIADALIGGTPVTVSSSGGGSSSDLRWDGRRPDEEEEAYRRRCLMFVIVTVCKQQTKSYRNNYNSPNYQTKIRQITKYILSKFPNLYCNLYDSQTISLSLQKLCIHGI